MTVSLRAMSAGDGYRYLTASVAVADGPRDRSLPLAEYYAQTGTPPGRWLGAGLAALGLEPGDVVTEDQMARLLGAGRDPVTGDALGQAFPQYKRRAERVGARVASLDGGLGTEQRASAVQRIEQEEAARPTRRAVAGFDLTFSAPKSVSVWWALAPPEVRERIVAAHHAAIGDVVELMEREVAATRAGRAGVVQLDVDGLIATAFDHYDSRTGDPQLHTHVVIANKVCTTSDGKWRSLDSRPVYHALVALSERYNAALADRLSADLGVQWEQRTRGADRNPAWEIAGIPDELVKAFSSRSRSIDTETDRLVPAYRATHGVGPTPKTVIKLRQQATLATRPGKTQHPLAELTSRWADRARSLLGFDPAWLRPPTGSPEVIEGLPAEAVEGYALVVLDHVSEKRSTWTRWNLHAEATRQTMHLRFATPHGRNHAIEQLVEAAERASLRVTPPETAVPAELQRPDGTGRLRPKHATRYTSHALVAAEDRLLDRSRTASPRLASQPVVASGSGLSQDQLAAVADIATSGRQLDLLIGPAGAGKTTTLAALRQTWEHTRGAGAVIGLAPSAAAAQVLADDLGIATENTAKWTHEHLHGRWRFRPGQLVIVDEASLASTRTLDLITGHAEQQRAKVLLVGDPHQLGAVGAGGALGLLARDRPDHPRLTQIHRFHHHWERHATQRLRDGDPGVIDTYREHGRIHAGATDHMLQQAYLAWRNDLADGHTSVLIAADNDQVTTLNQRARLDRQANGDVSARHGVPLRDGTAASAGDWILTRRNRRTLQASDGKWVRNGDRWTVTATHTDGSLTAHRPDQPAATVRIPADYAARHVDLGYATTVHRAQGSTAAPAHTIATPAMTREQLYVALTRGRTANHVYTATDQPTAGPHLGPAATPGDAVLARILRRHGAARSAHEAITDEQTRWNTTAHLTAEHQAIGATQSQPSDATTRALRQRYRLLEQHGDKALRSAIEQRQPWIRHLNPPPTDPERRRTWWAHARAIATYRDRHRITDHTPLGQDPGNKSHPDRREAVRALRVLQRRDAGPGQRPPTPTQIARTPSGPTM